LPEHLDTVKIPPKLLQRWRTFAQAARESWRRVHEMGLRGPEAMVKFWELMREKAKAGVHLLTYEEAKKYGVKPHHWCVYAKVLRGIPRAEAEEECLREGKFHIASLARAEIRKAEEEGLISPSNKGLAYDEMLKILEEVPA